MLTYALLAVVTVMCSEQKSRDGLEQAIAVLAESGGSSDVAAVAQRRTAIATIRGLGRGPGSKAVPRLLALVRDDPVWAVWQDALETACAVAEREDVPRIVAVVRREIEHLADARAARDDELREKLMYRTTTLCAFFLERCVRQFPGEGRGASDLLQLLSDMEVPAAHGWIIAGDPLRAALRMLPSAEDRAAHIVDYVRRRGTYGPFETRWGTLALVRPHLNESVKEGLHHLVVESSEAGQLNKLAAGALAEWGDARLLPLLRRLQRQNDPDFAKEQIWQIETQNPSTRLLALISGEIGPSQKRLWAFRRAVEGGLRRTEIAQAVTRYCEQNDVDDRRWRFVAATLKGEAVRADLIDGSDLPMVPHYSDKWETPADWKRNRDVGRWIRLGPRESAP